MHRLLVVLTFALAFLPRTATARPPDPELVERLGRHVKALDEIRKHASFRLTARTEELDGSGKVSSVKTRQSRVEADGDKVREVMESAAKDGKDVTAEERESSKKKEEEAPRNKPDKGDSLLLPFASPGYVYDEIAVDAANPSYVRISFVPKMPSKRTLEGSAWVDTTNGTVLTGSAKLSEPPRFVDWVHFTVELGAKTPLGPAISHLTFEAKGGFLFVRRHVRGDIRMTDYSWKP